ncbi:hypothetical protein RI103_33180 [Paraburkholderia sp. FT54]|uniref:hypothetical protein n=1 Tax=Paraburkholderia sp. FT54 TaxID=3074437 RepID=UPI0028775167|nr:hypothetical protein [Paraburkholderia sp. FT54]WNC94797.1 hypothetical protein RI103_33180 [Paraburkholderia sp. FT54]
MRFAPAEPDGHRAALRDCGFAHEAEEIKAAVDGICIADFPDEMVAALKMSIRMA